MTRRLMCGAIAVLVLAMAPDARGREPLRVSPRGMDVQSSELAARGGRTVVLLTGARTRQPARPGLLARIGRGTRLGRSQRLARSVFETRVALGPDGTAVAAWTVLDRGLRVAVAAPGRPFGRAQTVVRTGARLVSPGLAVAADGSTVVSWLRGSPSAARLQVAVRRPGHRFGATLTLGESTYPPAVAVSPTGAVLLAWLTIPRAPLPGTPLLEGNPRVLAATLPAGATAMAAPIQLAGPPSFVSEPVAVGGPGGAGVTWGEPTMQGTAVARIARLGLDDRWETIDALPTGIQCGPLALAMPVGGAVTALWRFGRDCDRVLSSFRPGAGPFLPSQKLSAVGWRAGLPVAVVAGQRTIATWSESTSRRGARLRAVAQSAPGEWSTPLTLSTAKAIDHVAAATDRTRALIAWLERDGRGRGRAYLTDLR